ncbi:alpha/beta hydrolase family esterase [Nocardia sp. NPDC059177]|uniref:alpha/beta hydrolase family esterase n=1 Tax=Nocardia sp. NPDC059177 TaxID=3346759 RepID=UPI00368E905A
MNDAPSRLRKIRGATRVLGALAAAVVAVLLSTHAVATAGPAATASPAAVPSAGCAASQVEAGRTMHLFRTDARSGRYIQDVPAAQGIPMPVVFDIHGYLQPGLLQSQWSGIAGFGLRHGFVTITPDADAGLLPRWEYGRGGADIAYLSAMLTQVEQTLCVDRRRIYMTGLSMGAFTTSSVACQLADRFAAVAPVAGIQDFPWCEPARRVPVVAFHGTGDQFLSYTGGVGPVGELLPATDGSSRLMFQQRAENPAADNLPSTAPIPAQTAAWAARNGCGPEPATEQVTADVTRTTYPCDPDASVELYTVHGGGHTWPGGDPTLVPVAITGPVTHTIEANRIIWEFFRDHPHPGPIPS